MTCQTLRQLTPNNTTHTHTNTGRAKKVASRN